MIKTRKGLEEIEKRTHKLPGRLRAILFMVDGERTFAGLLDQAGNMAGPLEIQLQELATMGFIAAIAGESTAGRRKCAPPFTEGVRRQKWRWHESVC